MGQVMGEQARVGIWDGHTRYRRASTTSLHNREASTTSVITGQGHGVRRKREEDAATSLGHVIGSNVRLARSCVAHSFFTEDRRWHGNEDDDGREERDKKEDRRWWRDTTVEWARSRSYGTLDSWRRLWPGHPLLVACSWSMSDQRPCSTCLPPALPAWMASCVRLQARSGGEAISVCFVFFFLFWRGGGGSTIHCHHNDLEVSRTYGNTQISTSRMLWECLAYDTPWCTHNRTYFDDYSIFSFVEVRALRGDLSMACHVDGMP